MANIVGQESPVDRDGCDWDVCAADMGVSPARDAAEFGQQRREVSSWSEGKGGSNSVVESQPSKLLVAGSIPVSRSILEVRYAHGIGPSGVAKSRRPRDDSKPM
jgi:hypothetical protein